MSSYKNAYLPIFILMELANFFMDATKSIYYNFCRIHQTLRITPVMAEGVTDHLWEIEDIFSLLS
jgi:hypothetical protein